MIIDPELLRAARDSAVAAAIRSRVELRRLERLDAIQEAEALFSDIWGRDPVPMAAHLMRALSSAGSYIVGAYEVDAQSEQGGRPPWTPAASAKTHGRTRGRMVAACVGFWGPPDRPSLHSHIAGVAAAARGRDLGFALKLHQRAEALAHGVQVINWTYDPLIARNAHFNLHKLGGRAAAYAVNHYGVMPDAINAGDETDRMVLRWELDSAAARAACDGAERAPEMTPTPAAEVIMVEIPNDIESLRRTDPELAAAWRRKLRDQLFPLLDSGGRIIDFDRVRSSYRVETGQGNGDQE